MESKTKQASKSNWKDIVQGFVVNMLENIGDDISRRAHVWLKNFKRKSIGSILMTIGLIFLLVAVVLLINTLTKNIFPWLGYLIVGLVTVAVGYVMTKE